jgi:hypothetical protein
MASPGDIVDPFLFEGGGNSKKTSDASVDKVTKFNKNINDHIRAHYAIYASQSLAGPGVNPDDTLSTLDLLYYHVYGDYRLTLAPQQGSNAPEFIKSTGIPSTIHRYISAPPQNIKSLKGRTNGRFFEDYLAKEVGNEDKLKGVLKGNRLATEQSATEWFQRELTFGSAANKFHLPSLGTMAVNTMGATNTAREIRDAAISSLETMYSYIEHNRDVTATPTNDNVGLPEFLTDAFDPKLAPLKAPEANNDMKLIHAIHDALVNNLEYLELARLYPARIPTDAQLLKTAQDSYEEDNSRDVAVAYITGVLASLNLKYDLGMPVLLKTPGVIEHAKKSGHDKGDLEEAQWIVTSAKGGSDKDGPTGVFSIKAPDVGGIEVTLDDVKHSHLELRVSTLADEEVLEAAATKKRYLTNAPSLVFFRIFLDILFSFEAVICASEIRYQPRKIDNSINKSEDLGICAKNYPNMVHIFEDPPFNKDALATMKKGFIPAFSEIRTTHTLASLANLDSIARDSKIEDFYKEDLRLSEVLWLTQALTDEGKAVLERQEKPNLLAQLQYTTKGVGEGVTATAPVNAKTIFYQLDSPILKDVIMKYDQLFIHFTVQNAYAPSEKQDKADEKIREANLTKDKKDRKDIPYRPPDLGKLATAIWASIEGRSSDILNRTGVQPHKIFNSLFAMVEELSKHLYGVTDNYPPQWTGTNTVAKLSRDPIALGEEIDMKFYSDRMTEYLRHLKSSYGSQPAVATEVLTILGDIVIQAEGNIDNLRESFIARIKSQSKRGMLKGKNIRFDAYRAVMCVMRSEIDIPLRFREEFVAQALDESQREQLKKTFSDEGEVLVLPETHPEFKEIVIDEGDPESALFGLDNPHRLPQPEFYPKTGSVLNKTHPEVAKLLAALIGKPGRHFFPKGSLFSLATQKWTTDEVRKVKKAMLKPETTYTVMDIGWKGETKIWDGRDNSEDPPNSSVVSHYRDNYGIIFSINTPDFDPFEFDILAGDLTDYDTILYSKYTNDKFDTANYVYTPPGGVFKNPHVAYSSTHGKTRVEDPDFTSGNSFMIYRGEIAPQPKPKNDPIRQLTLDLDGALHDGFTDLSTATDLNTTAVNNLAASNTLAITDAGNKVAAASEKAGESFEAAGKSFEAAGKEFTKAGRHYELAAKEFSKIPDALKVALTEASTSFIEELENKFGSLADFNPEENSAVGEAALDALGGMVVIEGQEDTDYIEGALEAIQNISQMLPGIAYNYRNFTTHLKDIYFEDRTADNFLSAPSNKKTGKQVRASVTHSLAIALVAQPTDDKLEEDNLLPKELKALLWRKWCIGVIDMMRKGDYDSAKRALGIEEWEEPIEAVAA